MNCRNTTVLKRCIEDISKTYQLQTKLASKSNSFSIRKLPQKVNFLNLLCKLADKQIYIILCDTQTTVSQKSGEGYDVTSVQYPLLCKGVSVSVYSGGFNASAFVIAVQHTVTSAFYKLLTVDVAEKPVVRGFVLTVL